MPILDIQKRARELGRIRIGQVVPTTKRDGTTGTRPEKLDRFRLTSASKPLLGKVAELYGGTVTEWSPQGGGPKAWEVVTDSQRLPIMVPPQPISQWYEFWTAGGCKHRCDGRTNVLTDELCDPDDYGHQEAIKRPTTRLNVVLRDVEGIGVWRLETHGFNAAVELPDAAEFLARAGGYVNGWVSLEPRTSKAEVPDRENGGTKIQTRHFHVPIIEIDVTPAQLMAGRGRVATPQVEGPVERKAIEAAPTRGPVADELATYYEQLEAATTSDEVMAVYEAAKALGILGGDVPPTHPLYVAIGEKGRALAGREAPPAAADAEPEPGPPPFSDPEPELDPNEVWQQVVAAAGKLEMTLSEVEEDFAKNNGGVMPNSADASELQAYLGQLKARAAA